MRCDASHKLRASTRDYERTYSMNRYASGSTGNEFNADFNVPAGAEFASPSKTALFIDGAIGATGGVYWSAIRHTELAASSAAQPLYPHGGSVNVVFVDGHVERVTRGVMTGEHSLSANTSFWRHHR